jgi:C-terminal processing protease CtpA/Prc
MERFKKAIDGKINAEQIISFGTKHLAFNPASGHNKPIYILTDGGCASSGESTAAAFEHHPEAKKVGRNTAGFIHFGNVGIIVLPHSKITVQISTSFQEYADHRFLEKTGIKPDIETAPGQDAYDVAVQAFKHRHR